MTLILVQTEATQLCSDEFNAFNVLVGVVLTLAPHSVHVRLSLTLLFDCLSLFDVKGLAVVLCRQSR